MKGIVRSLSELAQADDAARFALVGELHAHIAARHTETYGQQTKAWQAELELLCEAARTLAGELAAPAHVVLEYDIPRRQRRPDAVVVTDSAIVVVEFKIGAKFADAAAKWQAASYALDLRDFHSASSGMGIAALVVATGGRFPTSATHEGEIPVVRSDGSALAGDLRSALALAQSRTRVRKRDPARWIEGSYRPTPTIIQAAEALYRGHGVNEINHAYAQNLTETTDAIVEYIRRAEANREHLACFVTGVPGAGKTLTGLNAVHDPRLSENGHPRAIFLSGNSPLVEVIRAALARTARPGEREEAERRVRTFIQNVHHFAREYEERSSETPFEHVVIFDEAQRAWSAEKMIRAKRGSFSEPAQLLRIMERWNDWSVVVALVGGGQEIHDGEAGLGAWGDALANSIKNWTVIASPEAISGGVAVSGHKLFRATPRSSIQVLEDPRLHLRISVRSPRAQLLAEWVDAVLSGRADIARERAQSIRDFPLVGTQDIRVARAWLCARAADGKRAGLVASAGARRLRAYGLQLSTRVGQNSDIDQWFLADADDVRSSSYLEVAATEFECQGLELDLVGLCWGDDFTWNFDTWEYRRFRGSSWSTVGEALDQEYIRNKYRVLLTRARVGLMIWVPPGSIDDPTRDPARMSRTWDYLLACGVRPVTANVVEHTGAVEPTVEFSANS